MERGTKKWIGAAAAVVVFALAVAAIAWATGVISLPFQGTAVPGDETGEPGQAHVIGTAKPQATPTETPSPPAETPAPAPPTPAPPSETRTPAPPRTPPPAGDLDVGVHGWGFALETMVEYPQKDALISILIPSMMVEEGYSWSDMVAAAGWAGPAESKFDRLARSAAQAAGEANAITYVPEGNATSASVPVSETIDLEGYLDRLVALAREYDYKIVYGPGLQLISEPDTWAYGKFYDLQNERVTGLASRLPDDSFWILRMHTPELMYRKDLAGFRGAVEEVVEAIHAGNPTTRIILHVSCPAGSEARFVEFVNASRDLIDMAYMGIDPVRDNEGTRKTMAAILEATDAAAVDAATGPPRPTAAPPAAVPSPAATPSTVHYDLAYGPDPRNVLDLYLPDSGQEPYPTVIWIHGGGFKTGDKKMVRNQAAALTAAGFAFVAANYRLEPTYLPEQVYDVKAVVRWTRGNAEKYGLDPNRIGAIGGSAGAILAANLGTSGGVAEVEGDVGDYLDYSSSVQASVGLAGVYDWFNFYKVPIRACANLQAGTPECQEHNLFYCGFNEQPCLDRLRQSSAMSYVSAGDPPSMVVIGDEDMTMYGIEDHQAYHEALLAAGVDSTLHILPGYEHGEMLPDIHPLIIDWFTEHLMGED
ncbi:MAG TPA: alpha/beta hydrolase [Anaerolineae bacterium]|nr:alpha/beta hydrolase [Anaerolineae bacterium]